jgi:hypothetical protein
LPDQLQGHPRVEQRTRTVSFGIFEDHR